MARRAFNVTEEMRELVLSLAARGVRHEDIAKTIGWRDAKTVRKHFRDELDRGAAKANADVAGALYEKAMRGDVTAAIFWLKSRAGWREKEPEKPMPSSDAEQSSHTVIVLPDNNRNLELTEELLKTQEKYYAKKRLMQNHQKRLSDANE